MFCGREITHLWCVIEDLLEQGPVYLAPIFHLPGLNLGQGVAVKLGKDGNVVGHASQGVYRPAFADDRVRKNQVDSRASVC